MHQDKFKDINNAYQVLSDEKKKKQYDDMREAPKSNQGDSQGNGGQDFYSKHQSQ